MKQATPAAGWLRGAAVSGGLSVLFYLILLWRDPLVFWKDDFALSVLPVLADVARSWSEGEWPLLSPYSWVCSNLAGEYQYGTFSVVVNALVFLTWQLPLGFPQQTAVLSLVHVFILGAGGYTLARGRDLAPPLAHMVGFIAALNGWMVCWGATDWFGALAAFAWLPWAWWAAERALDPACGPRRFLWPAPFVYLLVTGGFPYVVVMFGVLCVFLSVKTWMRTRKLFAVLPLAAGVLLGIGLSAPAWLALIDYVDGSAREAQDAASHRQWLVPPAAWPGLILPSWTVSWSDFSNRFLPHVSTELAAGIAAPAILLFALARNARAIARRCGWELALLVFLFIAAMLPTTGVFRWSFRWLPFLHLVLALCAAEAWQTLRKEERGPARLALALVGASILFMWLAGTVGPHGWFVPSLLLGLAGAWLVLERFSVRPWLPPAFTFLSLLATFLVISPNGGVPKFPLDPRLTEAAPLDPARLYLSVYPPPEQVYRASAVSGPVGLVVRPGSSSMWGAVRLVNGYSPIRPAGVATQFDFQIHGELAPWSAEYFPIYEAGPNGLLRQIGVDGILVARELAEIVPQPAEEWQLVFETAEGRVYHRRGPPLPLIQPVIEPGRAPARISSIASSRHRMVADVAVEPGERAALLTFARPFFRGYRATLEGRPLEVHAWRGLVPAVEVPPGAGGRLELVYRPIWLIVGAFIAGVSIIVIIATLLLRKAQGKGAAPKPEAGLIDS